jgi:excisionase family DNA binding protein
MSDVLAYSVEGAAAAARLGRTKIFEAIKAGRLRARKDGRRTVILKEDLTAFLRALPERETGSVKRATKRSIVRQG